MTTAAPRHPGLGDRWATFSIMEQLANVGSEVARTIRAHEAGNASRFDSALARALELFDLTAADARWRGPRRREILRAREEFCRLFFSDTPPADSIPGLQRYFLYAAIAANRQRAASIASDGGKRAAGCVPGRI
jgi:hypothetical protein